MDPEVAIKDNIGIRSPGAEQGQSAWCCYNNPTYQKYFNRYLNKITTQSCRIQCYFLFYVEVFFGINVHNLYHVLIV